MCSGPPERTGVSFSVCPVPPGSRDVTQGLFAGCMPQGIPQGSRRPVWVRKAETPCFPVEPLPAGGGAFPGGSAPPRAHLSSPLLWERGLVSCVTCAFRRAGTLRESSPSVRPGSPGSLFRKGLVCSGRGSLGRVSFCPPDGVREPEGVSRGGCRGRSARAP